MLKRCISLLIAVCLISGFGISAAFAEEPVDEASVYLEESCLLILIRRWP